MKIIAVLTMITLFITSLNAQYDRQNEFYTHYGINVSQIYSGSGHGYGISVNTNIQKGRKSLEVGAIYQARENKLAGADFRFKIFFGQFNEVLYRNKSVKPYILYNLIYQKATVHEKTVLKRTKGTVELPDDIPGIIATMEHYAAIGIQLKLHKGFYIDSSLGLGAYIGSINKEQGPGSFGLHKENHGYTSSLKLGLGYRFN
jgi:hypothetical protein